MAGQWFTKLKNYNRRQWFWLAVIVVYAASRLLAAVYLQPHNDEVIYTRYAQLIHQDWNKYKFISASGTVHNDFKEPLQYWLTSLTVDWWPNPLAGVRLWSIILGLVGLLFTARFIKRLWGETTARIFAVLVLFSGYYFYFDSLGLTEVYVYGLGAVFIYYFYDWLERSKSYSLVTAAIFLAAAFLSKDSAKLLLVFAAWLPWCFFVKERLAARTVDKHYWLTAYSFLAMIFSLAWLSNYWLVLARFWQAAFNSPAAKAVFNLQELLRWPLANWLANLKFYFYFVLDFSWLGGLFIFVLLSATVLTIAKRRQWQLWWLAVSGWLLSFAPLLLLAKFQYLRYYGQWLYFFYLLLAVAAIVTGKEIAAKIKITPVWRRAMVIGGLLILFVYQSVTAYWPAIKYGQTDSGELETGDTWSSPLGSKELLNTLAKLPPGLLIYDYQWGHVATDIKVFADRFPQLKTVPLSDQSLTWPEIAAARRAHTNLYFLFDGWNLTNGPLIKFFNNLINNQDLCAARTEIKRIYRGRVYQNSWLIICRAAPAK